MTPPHPRVGDPVFYVPDCTGDMCTHRPTHDRAAIVTDLNPDGTVALTVFHPVSVAHLPNVPYGGPGRLGTWYRRETL